MHGLTPGGIAPMKMKEDSVWLMMGGGDLRDEGNKWVGGPEGGQKTVDEWMNGG